MCQNWADIVGIITGAGLILFLNLFDAITRPHVRQSSTEQLNRILEKGLRKFPRIIGERRFSENYMYTQVGALFIIFIALTSVIRRTLAYIFS
jgi:hypothetical protein